jgi:hypothetical protein
VRKYVWGHSPTKDIHVRAEGVAQVVETLSSNTVQTLKERNIHAMGFVKLICNILSSDKTVEEKSELSKFLYG